MSGAFFLLIMSASFFNPSFALSSHFDSDGAPLSELSWSSSLAVVAVSFSGLFTFIFLMLACLCCKRGDIGFKEFENVDGEDGYPAETSTPASPATHSGPDVYILPLSEVSLPVAKQPGRAVQLQRSTDLGRHNLLYVKEIGHGWFGKVLLGEVHSGLSGSQVVVKELKSSASVQEQMHFLEETRPYRSLQHPALVQCLAHCTEVTPYLVVMEFCPLGDVKGYLHNCRAAEAVTPDPLMLQRMACEITSGLLHLHKNNFIHSDLALRNCLLTSDINVKIGDYGLAHNKYKEDYFVTSDQTWVPLRWIAPEIVDEVHGNLLVVDQTKESNIWSLGVTIWELFELGNRPYQHYSDRQVLSYAVKDQQLKLPMPLLKYPLADRWYEVMQFCWLQPDQRPTGEEVHLLLSYLCAKGASEAEEDFERRWNSMRPNTRHANVHESASLAIDMPMSSITSSFPLLEQFPTGDGYHSESGDDILTVTETSHGLNFEYKWEQAKAKQHYHSSSASGTLGKGDPHCREVYYPPGGLHDALSDSSPYYDPKQLHTPGVVPVLSARSPSLSNEYYIRIEEPVQSNIDLNFSMCTYSPEFRGSNGAFLTGIESVQRECPNEAKPDMYWSADFHKTGAYDSDTSPAISLTMEPLLSHGSPLRAWESGHYVSYKDRDGGYYYEPSPPCESWGSRSLREALGELEDPLAVTTPIENHPRVYSDSYLENMQGSIIGKNVSGGYYDMMGSLRKTMPGNHSVCIDMATGGAVFVGQEDSDSDEEDIFVERRERSWSANNQIQGSSLQDSYADFHYTMPMTDVEDAWPEEQVMPYPMIRPVDYLEGAVKSNTCLVHGRHVSSSSSTECSSYIHTCHEPREAEVYPVPCCQTLNRSHFVDPLTGALVTNCFMMDCVPGTTMTLPNKNQQVEHASVSVGNIASCSNECVKKFVDISVEEIVPKEEKILPQDVDTYPNAVLCPTPEVQKLSGELHSFEPESELSKTLDSGVDHGSSSISLVEIDDCSDDDITDVTSGIFGDLTLETEAEYTSPALKSLPKQSCTPDSMDSIDIPSTACSSETLSPASIHPSSSPRTVDSGYDTENNESPEFVLRENHELQENTTFVKPVGMIPSSTDVVSEENEFKTSEVDQLDIDCDVNPCLTLANSETSNGGLKSLSEETPYRDSAYFSDYDSGRDKESEEDTNEPDDQTDRPEEAVDDDKILSPQAKDVDEFILPSSIESEHNTLDQESAASQEPFSIENDASMSSNNESLTIKNNIVDDCFKEPSEHLIQSQKMEPSTSPDFNDIPDVSLTNVTDDGSSPEYLAFADSDANRKLTSVPDVLHPEVTITDETSLHNEKPVVQIELAEENIPWALEELECKTESCKEEGKRKRSSVRTCSPPPPPLEERLSSTDGEEADEEYGDSEDSDESDEELRTYNIQEQSEESEEEAVPIIVSDCSDAHKLRSLLKMPTTFNDSMESKKKVVSFFDDVTVFLFDQESPTRDLVDHGFPLTGDSSPPNAESKQQEKVNASDDSSDGNISEESAGFEWEDDFPLLPLSTSNKGSPPDNPTSLHTAPAAKLSRFTVSPSSVSRFSITHVTDSDMDSAGGSSEDGDRD